MLALNTNPSWYMRGGIWKLWNRYRVPDLFPSSDSILSSEPFNSISSGNPKDTNPFQTLEESQSTSFTSSKLFPNSKPSKAFSDSASTFLASPFTLGFTCKELSTPDRAQISYRTYPWASHVPMVIFVHGLFGNSHLFHSVASTLSLWWVPSVSIDLRWFWNSSLGNTKRLTIETFARDILLVLQNEQITNMNNSIHPTTHTHNTPIILVWYSMWTLVTSLVKKYLTSKNDQEIESHSERDHNITLFHVSPIVDIKKRRFLRHVFVPWLGELDLKLLSKPLILLRLISEILSSRHLVELSWYIISWLRDFCFYQDESSIQSDTHPDDMNPNNPNNQYNPHTESSDSSLSHSNHPPYILHLFKQEDHYLVYRIPRILTNYLLLAVFKNSEKNPS